MFTTMNHNPNEFMELRHLLRCDNPKCQRMNPPKRCSRCQTFYYCNVECQREHWNCGGHKEKCISVEEQHARISKEIALPSSADDSIIEDSHSCGICGRTPMQHPTVLSCCRNAFCFKCIVEYQGDGEVAQDFMHDASACPKCGEKFERRVMATARATANACVHHIESVLDDDDVLGKNKLYRMALKEVDKVLHVRPNDPEGLAAKTGLWHFTNPKKAIVFYEMDIERPHHSIKSECTLRMRAASAYEKLGDHKNSIRHYHVVAKRMTSCPGESAKHEALGDVYGVGLSRAFFKAGWYKEATGMVMVLVEKNRSIAGAHKVWAMILLAQAKESEESGATSPPETTSKYPATLAGAIHVMYEGFAYENPWHEKNYKANRLFLQQLLDQQAAAAASSAAAATGTASL